MIAMLLPWGLTYGAASRRDPRALPRSDQRGNPPCRILEVQTAAPPGKRRWISLRKSRFHRGFKPSNNSSGGLRRFQRRTWMPSAYAPSNRFHDLVRKRHVRIVAFMSCQASAGSFTRAIVRGLASTLGRQPIHRLEGRPADGAAAPLPRDTHHGFLGGDCFEALAETAGLHG